MRQKELFVYFKLVGFGKLPLIVKLCGEKEW